MTYELTIADRRYSSWSLRGWLMFEKFGLPVRLRMAGLYTGTFRHDLGTLGHAKTVPVLRTPEGWVVGDTLAIAETLAERHPKAGLWPVAPEARAHARWLAAEMHSGFTALRGACPMMLRHAWEGFVPPRAVQDDIARVGQLWSLTRDRFGNAGSPWLFGRYTLADAFFAPVATRIATYGLDIGKAGRGYVDAHLSDPAFRRWRAMGLAEGNDPEPYEKPLPPAPWPGPAPQEAEPCEGPSENAVCPYSGKPVRYFLCLNERVFGFCNRFCRDKTLADPDAWPAFATLLERPC